MRKSWSFCWRSWLVRHKIMNFPLVFFSYDGKFSAEISKSLSVMGCWWSACPGDFHFLASVQRAKKDEDTKGQAGSPGRISILREKVERWNLKCNGARSMPTIRRRAGDRRSKAALKVIELQPHPRPDKLPKPRYRRKYDSDSVLSTATNCSTGKPRIASAQTKKLQP